VKKEYEGKRKDAGYVTKWAVWKKRAAEQHLSGIIGTASQPDIQNIRIIEFFCENGFTLAV
jgi:hypothetical protein